MELHITHTVRFEGDNSKGVLNEILARITTLQTSQNQLKMNVQDLIQKVTDENTAIGSYTTLMDGIVTGLQTEIDALKAQGVDTAGLQTLSDDIDAGKAEIAAAVAKNTPNTPTDGTVITPDQPTGSGDVVPA